MVPERIWRQERHEFVLVAVFAMSKQNEQRLPHSSLTRLDDEARAMLIKHLTAKTTEDDIFKYQQDQTVDKAKDKDASKS